MTTQAGPAHPEEWLPPEEFDARLIEEWWQGLEQYRGLPPESSVEDEFQWAHENDAAWAVVDEQKLGVPKDEARALMAQEVAQAASAAPHIHAFHLPGKHNQKDHGRKGVRGLYSKASAGGFTYNVAASSEPKTGFALSPYPERSKVIPTGKFTSADIKTYNRKNADLLSKPDHYLGAWREKDGKTDQVWLDVSIVKPSRAAAEKTGKEFDQRAMFDLARGEEINLGGTGGQ